MRGLRGRNDMAWILKLSIYFWDGYTSLVDKSLIYGIIGRTGMVDAFAYPLFKLLLET